MKSGRFMWEQMKQQGACTETSVFQTIVEILGDRRILIENHRGVVTYSKEKILVKVKYGTVSVCGRNLELTSMTKDQLVIFGNIQSVSLHRREQT